MSVIMRRNPSWGTSCRELLHNMTAGSDAGVEAEQTLDVRIIGVFVILAAGLAGGLLPLFCKVFKSATHPATLMMRAASAGVILALAILHVLPEGMEQLASLHPYPFGPLFAILGILIMSWLETISRALFDHGHGHCHTNAHEPKHSPSEPAKVPLLAVAAVLDPVACGADHPTAVADGGDAHTHTCVAVNNAANWVATLEVTQTLKVRDQMMAYMFELACITHSVLIGIALGVTTGSRSAAVALILALTFHQLLEGIGLGSTLVRAGFSQAKGLTMICTYAVTTPLGAAIGIAIAGSYDAESLTALAVQGTLNSISAGLLLYIALVQLIAEDFTRSDLQSKDTAGLRVGMHLALAAGVAGMAVIAVWA